jgi:hypothetical protein
MRRQAHLDDDAGQCGGAWPAQAVATGLDVGEGRSWAGLAY